MTTTGARNFEKDDVPQRNFSWSKFSELALTFDPLFEAASEFNQMPANATPSDTWTVVALRNR